MFGVAVFPIQKDGSLAGLGLGNEDKIVEERSNLPNRFDDSAVIRGVPLFQAEQEGSEITGVASQIAVVFYIPLRVPSSSRQSALGSAICMIQ